MKPVIHPQSKQLLDAVFEGGSHAVLLTGPTGIGLATIAKHYARSSSAQRSIVLPTKNEAIDLEKGTSNLMASLPLLLNKMPLKMMSLH